MENRPLIAFDAMGVVFEDSDDVTSCLIPFMRSRGAAAEDGDILAAYRKASLGAASAREFWEGFGLGGDYPSIQDAFLEGSFRLDPGFVPAAEELSAWADMALLSNDLGEWSSRLRAIHGIGGYFSFAVVSGDAGMRKPSKRIFELFLEKAARAPGRVLFIDDRPLNLKIAAETGMRTLHFERLRREDGRPAPGTEALEGFRPDASAASMLDAARIAKNILEGS